MKCIFQDKSTFVGLAISAWFSALIDVNIFNTYREHWLSESLNSLLETMAIIIVSCHGHAQCHSSFCSPSMPIIMQPLNIGANGESGAAVFKEMNKVCTRCFF